MEAAMSRTVRSSRTPLIRLTGYTWTATETPSILMTGCAKAHNMRHTFPLQQLRLS
jgi:hypothetical protein